jgi:hypothetical protein
MININVADISLEVWMMPNNDGVRIWGNKCSFELLYNRLSACLDSNKLTHEDEQTYIGVVLGFMYEVRHVSAGDRLIRMEWKSLTGRKICSNCIGKMTSVSLWD